jgi:hypothetical protein
MGRTRRRRRAGGRPGAAAPASTASCSWDSPPSGWPRSGCGRLPLSTLQVTSRLVAVRRRHANDPRVTSGAGCGCQAAAVASVGLAARTSWQRGLRGQARSPGGAGRSRRPSRIIYGGWPHSTRAPPDCAHARARVAVDGPVIRARHGRTARSPDRRPPYGRRFPASADRGHVGPCESPGPRSRSGDGDGDVGRFRWTRPRARDLRPGSAVDVGAPAGTDQRCGDDVDSRRTAGRRPDGRGATPPAGGAAAGRGGRGPCHGAGRAAAPHARPRPVRLGDDPAVPAHPDRARGAPSTLRTVTRTGVTTRRGRGRAHRQGTLRDHTGRRSPSRPPTVVIGSDRAVCGPSGRQRAR